MDPSQSLSHQLQKLQAVPPPAYTATAAAPATQPQPDTAQPDLYTTTTTTAAAAAANDDDDNEGDEDGCCNPPIAIRIDAPLKVVGHANVVSADTQTMTARLASTVVAGLQQSLADAARARPVQVTVGCGVTVVGSRNVIGDGLTKALIARAAVLKIEMERGGASAGAGAGAGSRGSAVALGARKRRAESEPPRVQDAKRRDDREAPAAKALG